MTALPSCIHSTQQMRSLDAYAIDRLGIPGYELMTRAGQSAFEYLRECWPTARRIAVVCGPGNNGGDGYVVARLARRAGFDVRVSSSIDPARLGGDAARAWQDYVSAGGDVSSATDFSAAEVVVDALFGTGLTRAVEGAAAEIVQQINRSGRQVLSLDIASGLGGDDGSVNRVAVHATRTITFGGLKLGHFLGEGPDHTGQLHVYDLDLPGEAFHAVGFSAQRLLESEVSGLLPRRKRTGHKGEHGRVLIIGGAPGTGGAAALAGEAALRTGAGLVTVVTHPASVASILARRPELMVAGVQGPDELDAFIEAADVVALGPGLGRGEWGASLYRRAVDMHKPLVLDADGLNLLSAEPRQRADWILTPHPGEAGRLLGSNAADVQRDRMRAVRELAERYQACVVLKGAATLVLDEASGTPAICTHGNPGMGTAGMGDVLTGVIAGLIAQTKHVTRSARVGVLVHAMAGDRAAQQGERGLIATDLMYELRACLNPPY